MICKFIEAVVPGANDQPILELRQCKNWEISSVVQVVEVVEFETRKLVEPTGGSANPQNASRVLVKYINSGYGKSVLFRIVPGSVMLTVQR